MAIDVSLKGKEKVKDRSGSPKEFYWDVEALYPSWQEWEQELKDSAQEGTTPHWPQIEAFRDTYGDSPASLKKLIVTCLSIERTLSKLYTYAHLRHDEDVTSEIPKRAHVRISSLLHDFRQETSWIEPALFKLDEEKMRSFLEDESLKEYVFYLEKILRLKNHTLHASEEKLMARVGMALETASHAFGAFNNADLKFPPIQDAMGKNRELTHGTYLVYLRDKDRTLRENAFKTLHRGFLNFENTLCELLSGQVQAHVFEARARKYPSCLHAALFANQIDTHVYETLIKTVRSHLGALHDYVALRKKILKVDTIHAYDLQVPLVKEIEMHVPYEQAVNMIIESLEIMGSDYQNALRKGLTEARWVDRYENAHKRSGAYSSGCYDSMPYILMNYHGTFNDVMTLTHEAGHSMHSFLSRHSQPYHYSQYSIFVAEVASTFHEELLLRHFLKNCDRKEMEIFLLNQKIDDMRGTLLRQTLFAEFELKIHQWVEQSIPLTPALLKKEYRKLNQEYYGNALSLDSECDIEWARIPHFYYNFYVYQYATGISAAHALVESVLEKGKEARDKYLAFLSTGSRRYPLDALRLAGIDMEAEGPVDRAMKHFKSLVEALKKLTS